MSAKQTAGRFEFGANWPSYVNSIDGLHVRRAIEDLAQMLGTRDLRGKTFLDIGCGSGLMSLAAISLGADQVVSFDFDRSSVAASEALKARFGSTRDEWTIGWGDILDRQAVEDLGQFDIVMPGASSTTQGRFGTQWPMRPRPSGMEVFVSIYNDQGLTSRVWRAIKRTYNLLPVPLRSPYAIVVMAPREICIALLETLARGPQHYLSSWKRARERGMTRWHDLLDWVGGYAFEVAKPEEVFDWARSRYFELVRLRTAGGGIACNEFVSRRRSA